MQRQLVWARLGLIWLGATPIGGQSAACLVPKVASSRPRGVCHPCNGYWEVPLTHYAGYIHVKPLATPVNLWQRADNRTAIGSVVIEAIKQRDNERGRVVIKLDDDHGALYSVAKRIRILETTNPAEMTRVEPRLISDSRELRALASHRRRVSSACSGHLVVVAA